MHTILIIEDEEEFIRLLELELTYEGYIVSVETSGRTGLERALHEKWDLILLDIMLPELSGMEVLRRVRAANPMLSIIIVTARSDISDIVSGLDNGANDYVTKPFIMEELLARIRACLRVKEQLSPSSVISPPEILTVDNLTVNLRTREVIRECKPIELTIKEFDLLVYLIQNQPNAMTREQIIQQVWGYEFVGDTNIVDVYIRYLRKKVDFNFASSLIQTIRGIGYSIREGG